jgi:hypothetical protein
MLSAHLPESLKEAAKHAMYALAPQTATSVMSARARAYSHRLVEEWGLLKLNAKIVDRLGPTVQASLFRGMTLTPMTYREHLGPFLLGTYEEELHPWLESIVATRFARVLDIGSKFGYYAIGIARSMPDTEVVAFDTDGWARSAVSEMAVVNRTPRVTVAGFCSAKWLDRHLADNSFILSDCEGYERELFCRATTPALDSSSLLIEVHEQFAPGVTNALLSHGDHRDPRTSGMAVVSPQVDFERTRSMTCALLS